MFSDDTVDSPRINLSVCIDSAGSDATCKKSLQVSVQEEAAPGLRLKRFFQAGSLSELDIRLPDVAASPETSTAARSVEVEFADDTIEERSNRFRHATAITGRSIHREVESLLAIAETVPGDSGTEFLVPADGDKSVFIICLKPYRAASGNFVTATGCTVHSSFGRYVFTRYMIKRESLSNWREIHATTLGRLRTVIWIDQDSQAAQPANQDNQHRTI